MGTALRATVPADASVLVACSGGPDSIATLIAVARTHAGTVTAAWFDHAMRPSVEVAREGAFVRSVASALGIPMVEGRSTTTPRGEAAARTARYRWLARMGRGAGAVVCITGHTRDDQAETVLLRLVRGAGARGAAGMAPDSPWPVATPSGAGLRLLRPLLGMSRRDVETYLGALGVEAVQDPSNESREYARNRVRHDVLPVLAAVNGEAAAHLAAFADRERDDDAALTGWAERWLAAHAESSGDVLELPRGKLVALPPAVARRVIVGAGARLGVAFSEAHIEALVGLAAGVGMRVTLPGALAERRGTVVRMRRSA